MPTSKKRKPKAPRTERPADSGPVNLDAALLTVYEATTHLVREAELELTAAAREGDAEAVDKIVEVHHHIRTAGLGLLLAYSLRTGLPDPRGVITG